MPLHRNGGVSSLSRYWTALVQGAPPAELERLAAGLDPATLATIRQMRAMRDSSPPNQAFVDRLERSLVAKLAQSSIQTGAPTGAHSAGGRVSTLRDRLSSSIAGLDRRFERCWLSALAAAALLLVLGGIAARVFLDGREPGRFAQSPGIHAPATPTPSEEVIFEITLPAEIVPHTTGRTSGLTLQTYVANTESVYQPPCCEGPFLQYQLTGSIQVRAAAPIQILRADGTLEEIAADTEATINTGDTLITLQQVPMTTINSGAENVKVVTWALLDNPEALYPQASRFGQGESLFRPPDQVFGDHLGNLIPVPGAVTVRLTRMVLEPDDVVPLPEEGTAMLVLQTDPVVGVTVLREADHIRVINTDPDEPTTVHVITFHAAAEDATPIPFPIGT